MEGWWRRELAENIDEGERSMGMKGVAPRSRSEPRRAHPLGPGRPPPALIVAHPGHELRVYHWVERERPIAFVLTDGSGSQGQPRIASTERLLGALGVPHGGVFGALRDVEAYALLMRRKIAPFLRLADRLAAEVSAAGCTVMAGDACEGYNPMHDICRALVDVVSTLVGVVDAAHNLSIPLAGRPTPTPRSVTLCVDRVGIARKMAAARGYRELATEVAEAEARFGIEAFRHEVLEPTVPWTPPPFSDRPYYETYGEERVALGVYTSTLRYREHVLPVVEALARHAGR
jgi:hypothetical protein